jgi:chromosome segregation ATPase
MKWLIVLAIVYLAVAQTNPAAPRPAAPATPPAAKPTPPDFYVNYKDIKTARKDTIATLKALGKSLFDVKVGFRAVGAEVKKQTAVIKQHRDSVERLVGEVNQRKSKKDSVMAEAVSVAKALQDILAEYTTLTGKKTALIAEKRALKQSIKNCVERVTAMKADIVNKDAAIKQLEAAMGKQTNRLAKLQDHSNKLRSRFQSEVNAINLSGAPAAPPAAAKPVPPVAPPK